MAKLWSSNYYSFRNCKKEFLSERINLFCISKDKKTDCVFHFNLWKIMYCSTYSEKLL